MPIAAVRSGGSAMRCWFIAVENNRKGARAARAAWSHVLFSVESTEPGEPFDLDHLALTARDRAGSGLRQS